MNTLATVTTAASDSDGSGRVLLLFIVISIFWSMFRGPGR